jgi:hypothetical protein
VSKRRTNDRRDEKFRQRIEKQRERADRVRNGRMGAASACRRIDPVTGDVIEEVARQQVLFIRTKAAKGENGDERALAVLKRAGRDGASASWLADTVEKGEAKALSLLRRGLVVLTRSNRFVLSKWKDKAVPPLVTWDEQRKDADRRRIGMVEP